MDRLDQLVHGREARWRGSASLSAVAGPRPSTARAAHHIASCQRLPPPPQSPEMCADSGEARGGPSGRTPAQLMPAPQTTATPRGSSSPARSSAKVSLKTSLVPPSRGRRSRTRAPRARSAGRRWPGRRTRAGPGPRRRPGGRPRLVDQRREPATAGPAPRRCGRNDPPRAVPRTVPSAATIATSVLLFPASMARTAARWPRQAHGRWSRLWAISRSVSPSARSTCPTSGWASSASKTRS